MDPANLTNIIPTAVKGVMDTVYFLVGGLFGLYVISAVLRWWNERKMVRLLREIHLDIRHLNDKLGIPPPERSGLLHKLNRIKQKLNKRKK